VLKFAIIASMNRTPNIPPTPMTRPIGEDPESQAARGWTLRVNGEPVEDSITGVTLEHDKLGVKISYGERVEGFDGPEIRETGGGGSVTVPFMLIDGGIYIGMVTQHRSGVGGEIAEVPRGFLNPVGPDGKPEDHLSGAARETTEEVGPLDSIRSRLISLRRGVNPNTTFFNTTGTDQEGEPNGVAFYGLQVMPEEVEQYEVDGQTIYRFKEDIRQGSKGDKAAERITGTVFVPLEEAYRSPDMMTQAATGALLAHMVSGRVLQLADVRVE
jgi:hypothetical protein